MGLKPHKFAELLPMMSDGEYASLKADIAAKGKLIEPIILLDGKILDGRNRYRACEELKLKPATVNFKGSEADALDLVYSKANHRNLNDSQKACAAVNFLPHFERHATARMKAGGKAPVPEGQKGESRDLAGSLFGVSGRYVSEARLLFTNAPDLFADVFHGRTVITRAKREYLRRTKTKAIKAKARAAAKVVATGSEFEVVTGDCLAELPKRPAGSVRLAATDFPYNIGIDYGRGATADRLDPTAYVTWVGEVVDQLHRVLADDGSLFVMVAMRYADEVGMVLKQRFGRGCHRNTIVWHETFGSYNANNFTECWRPIFYFTKSDKYVWHGDAVVIPSDRQTKYADSRAVAAGKVPGNVWGEFPRLVDNAPERMPGFPTQVPQLLMERIVLAASEPGDLVLDPCNGTGTTGAAALKHRRRYLGIEQVDDNAAFSRARLAGVVADREAK